MGVEVMAAHNLGKITASTCSPMLAGKDPNKLIKGALTYAAQIALERLELQGLVQPDPDEPDLSNNPDIIRGNELEADALAAYSAYRFVPVEDSQVEATRGDLLACTPDGYIPDEGLVETKCPRRKKHFEYLRNPAMLEADYGDQARFQMYVTGREWCDLVSYCPLFAAPNDVVVHQVWQDPDWEQLLEIRVELMRSEIEKIIKEVSK